jgi:hypothetical protein
MPFRVGSNKNIYNFSGKALFYHFINLNLSPLFFIDKGNRNNENQTVSN